MQVKNVTPDVTTELFYSARLPIMMKRNLGKHFLRQWREYRQLSLRKLAERMEPEPGIPLTSHANLGRIETFQQPYSQEIMESAADALMCSVTDLLTVEPSDKFSWEVYFKRAVETAINMGATPIDLRAVIESAAPMSVPSSRELEEQEALKRMSALDQQSFQKAEKKIGPSHGTKYNRSLAGREGSRDKR